MKLKRCINIKYSSLIYDELPLLKQIEKQTERQILAWVANQTLDRVPTGTSEPQDNKYFMEILRN